MAIASSRSTNRSTNQQTVSLVCTNQSTVYASQSTVSYKKKWMATASNRLTDLYELVDCSSSIKNGWLLHPFDRQIGRSFHVEPKWRATTSQRLTGLYRLVELGPPVYIDRFQSVDQFIDKKAYKFSSLAPICILLSFPLSFFFLSLPKTLET